MKQQVFLPTKSAQDAKYVLNSKDNVFSTYLMKNFRAELSSPSGDYVISTEKGTTILNDVLSNNKIYIVGVTSYEKFAVLFCTNNSGHDFIITTEDFVNIKSMIIGCFGFSTNILIRATIADCSSHFKCFFADGKHPLRCVLIDKGTYIFKQSYYITLIAEEGSTTSTCTFYVKTFYRTISAAAITTAISTSLSLNTLASTDNNDRPFKYFMTSPDALDALSVSYCFERGITADLTTSNKGYYKCGTINFAIYDGRENLVQCNFVEDTHPYYLTSTVNKPNELASTSFIVNVDYNYLFARNYMFVCSKEISSLGSQPLYKESDRIFYVPPIIETEYYGNTKYFYLYFKRGSSDSYIKNKMIAEYGVQSNININFTIIYVSNNVTYIKTPTINSASDGSEYIRVEADSTVAVLAAYLDYNVGSYHWRVDVLIKQRYSVQLVGDEKMIEESTIYDRQRRAIIPDDVCMHAEKLFCNVSKNTVDDYTALNALIYANKDAISIENINSNISTFSSEQNNAKDATVFLPDTRYILGYQAKDIYGCWSPILLGEAAEKLETIPVRFKITLYDWFYYYMDTNLYVWDGIPLSVGTSNPWYLYNDGTTSKVSSSDATFKDIRVILTNASGKVYFDMSKYYDRYYTAIATDTPITDTYLVSEYEYSIDTNRNRVGLIITLQR